MFLELVKYGIFWSSSRFVFYFCLSVIKLNPVFWKDLRVICNGIPSLRIRGWCRQLHPVLVVFLILSKMCREGLHRHSFCCPHMHDKPTGVRDWGSCDSPYLSEWGITGSLSVIPGAGQSEARVRAQSGPWEFQAKHLVEGQPITETVL